MHPYILGEEGVLATARQLTLRPGRAIQEYLAGRTVRYLNPVGYLLLGAAVFTLVGRAVGGSTGAAESDRLFALLVIPFVALASRALFWRGPYNLAEHLIIVTYLSGHLLVLLTLCYLAVPLVPLRLQPAYALSALTAGLAFFVWGYGRVFQKRRLLAALAGFASVVLGATTWLLVLGTLVRFLRH